MAWIRSDLLALREERPTTTMFYERADKPLSSAGEEAARKLARVADLLIPEGKTQLFGAFSIADADLAFMLHRLILNDHAISPKARAFAEAQWQRDSIRAFVVRERKPAA
jgi:glutathione S-transferase